MKFHYPSFPKEFSQQFVISINLFARHSFLNEDQSFLVSFFILMAWICGNLKIYFLKTLLFVHPFLFLCHHCWSQLNYKISSKKARFQFVCVISFNYLILFAFPQEEKLFQFHLGKYHGKFINISFEFVQAKKLENGENAFEMNVCMQEIDIEEFSFVATWIFLENSKWKNELFKIPENSILNQKFLMKKWKFINENVWEENPWD